MERKFKSIAGQTKAVMKKRVNDRRKRRRKWAIAKAVIEGMMESHWEKYGFYQEIDPYDSCANIYDPEFWK